MSYIIVQYQNKEVLDELLKTEKDLVELTAKLFNKLPEEIIVDYVPFYTYKGKRKILVRAETSLKNIDLLNTWASEIKLVFQDKFNDFGIKTYVEDSRWQEGSK